MVEQVFKYGINWFQHKAKTNLLYIEDSDTVENWYILVQTPNQETIYLGFHKSEKRLKPFPAHIKTTKYPKKSSEHIKLEKYIEKYINKSRKYEDYQDYFSNCNFYVVGESKKELLSEIDPTMSKYVGKLSEEEYQLSIENIVKNKAVLSYPKESKSIQKQRLTICQYVRDAQIAAYAKQQALYKCEFNSEHKTFISEISNKQYVEAHHLIPMKYQELFFKPLDVPENIVALCPNCHRAIHYAVPEIKNQLISFLFNKRKFYLKNEGINISLDKLLEMYKK